MTLTSIESGWFIDDIELPIAPASLERRVIRKPDISQIDFGFPLLFNPGPQSFDLVLKGWIWPNTRASALDALARAAETEIVQLTIPIAEELSILTNGRYAIDRSIINIKGPHTTDFNGVAVAAWEYELTLIQFADVGENQDSVDAGIDLDEIGVGFGDINITFPEIDITNFDMFEDIGLGFLGI